MKLIRTTIPSAFLLALLLASGCRKHHQVPVIDQQVEKLTGTWSYQQVTLDGVEKDTYPDFKLTLSGAAGNQTLMYQTAGRPVLSPWPGAGTFVFDTANPTKAFTREDGVVISYTVTASTLSLKFNFSTPGYQSRSGSVKGAWDFELKK